MNSNYGDDGAVPHDSSNSEIQPAVKSSQTSLCVARWFAFRWIVVVLAYVDSLYESEADSENPRNIHVAPMESLIVVECE